MPQINLLKQKSSTESLRDALPKILVWLFLCVLIVVLGYYGWLFWDAKQVQKGISAAQATIAEQKSEATGLPNTDELVTRESQLKELDGLFAKHHYLSQLLPEIAKATLKSATYSDFKILPDGTLTLSASVPDFVAFDKFLQVFDLPSVNANFSDISVSGLRETQDQNGSSVKFDLKMKFNSNIINYKLSNVIH